MSAVSTFITKELLLFFKFFEEIRFSFWGFGSLIRKIIFSTVKTRNPVTNSYQCDVHFWIASSLVLIIYLDKQHFATNDMVIPKR